MKRHILSAAALMFAAIFSPAAINAQAVQFMDYNPDTRTAGLAGAGVSLGASAFSMWNNTAAPGLSDATMDIAVSYGLWQPSAAANSVISAAGYGRVAKFMTVSAGIKYFSYSPYSITDAEGLVIGSYTPKELTAGIGIAFRVLPILSVGANLHYVHSDIGGKKKGGAVSTDLGALLDLKFMRIGVTAANIGSKIDYGGPAAYNLPTNLKLGIGTTQYLGKEDKHALTASLQGGMIMEGSALFAEAGLEYAWNDIVRVSTGYHYGSSSILGIVPSYASIGAGCKFLGIYFNAAYIIGTSNDSPVSNSFSLSIGYTF